MLHPSAHGQLERISCLLKRTSTGEVKVLLNHPMQSDDMAFLNENNMPEIGKCLRKKKLGIFMGVKAASGFCTFPLYMLF